uniref:CASP-like protein n=1 Tax=Rhizophora mucronata TaxID=61149 RepID=A0A2P2NW31_RHIMU
MTKKAPQSTPNVYLQTIDVGRDSDPIFWVSRYITGRNIKQIICFPSISQNGHLCYILLFNFS